MLSLNIKSMCKSKGIIYPYAWLKKQGFSHNVAHTILSGHYRQPTLNMIEKLCLLFGCVPHDLLRWTPDKDQSADVPLAALLPKDETEFDWIHNLDKLPLDKLRALGDALKSMEKG